MTKARTNADNALADLTAVTAGTGITVTDSTGPIPTVAFDYSAGSAVTLNAPKSCHNVRCYC
jgi:hypothetical protein